MDFLVLMHAPSSDDVTIIFLSGSIKGNAEKHFVALNSRMSVLLHVSPNNAEPCRIAKCALEHYHSCLGTKGKPRQGEEWTVFAAIIAEDGDSTWVISSATGSKCTTTGPEGVCLRDMHAEVLAKRGLQRILWDEQQPTTAFTKQRLLEQANGVHRLKEGLRIHLYVSDSPCGDAAIYKLSSGAINFTGAKVLVRGGEESNHHAALLATDQHGHKVGRETVQELGALRIKSGRSNLPPHLRSTCMSCADKIVRWMVLGLQGTAMAKIEPVRLSSVIVSRDPSCGLADQQSALERATTGRMQDVKEELLGNKEMKTRHAGFLRGLERHSVTVHVVDDVFPWGMANLKAAVQVQVQVHRAPDVSTPASVGTKRTRDDSTHCSKTACSPCGFSINWNALDNSVEVVVGARGILQGKKPKSNADYSKLASRLCRQSMMEHSSSLTLPTTYRDWKASNASGKELKDAVLSTGPLWGWLQSARNFEFGSSGA